MLYLIPLVDAEGASSGVAQLIQSTQTHRKYAMGMSRHLIPENILCIKPNEKRQA